MPQVCPSCGIDEFVESIPLGPGFSEFTCGRVKSHPKGEAFVWQGTPTSVSEPSDGQGPVPIEDVREGLLHCVYEGEPWVEYGIVEKRYAKTAAEDFERIREAYGHRILGPKINPHFTASAYIGRALGDLRETGQLAHMTGRATAEWSYNGTISYWAKPPPGPGSSHRITCAEDHQ